MNLEPHGYLIMGLFVGLVVLTLLVNKMFRKLWRKDSPTRSFFVNLSLMSFTLLYLLVIGEAYFYWFNLVPDGFRFTLSADRWMRLHDTPINSKGYRDSEHSPRDFQGRKLLLCLGDSFTHGQGVPNYRDTFPQVLGRKLGQGWIVAIAAKGGWDTAEETEAFKVYGHTPDVVVFQYYVNDICKAALRHGVEVMPRIDPPSRFLAPVVNRSFLANRVYWSVFRIGMYTRHAEFWEHLRRCYEDPAIWADHAQELAMLAQCVRQTKARFICLVIPNLFNVRDSQPVTQKVAQLMKDLGAEVVDLTPLLLGRDPRTMVVNPLNGHANEALNEEIGEILFQTVVGPETTADPETTATTK